MLDVFLNLPHLVQVCHAVTYVAMKGERGRTLQILPQQVPQSFASKPGYFRHLHFTQFEGLSATHVRFLTEKDILK